MSNIPEMIGTPNTNSSRPVREAMCQTTWDKIAERDREINDIERSIASRIREIAVHREIVERLYAERQELAEDLNRVAPADWTPKTSVVNGYAMASAPSFAGRFDRPRPTIL